MNTPAERPISTPATKSPKKSKVPASARPGATGGAGYSGTPLALKLGIKAGHCPGICNTGFILDQPNLIVSLFDLLTCTVVDQCFRGIPGDSNCDTNLAESGIKEVCMCKAKVTPSQNMGGDMGGNGGAGMGMMGMSGGRKLRISGLEERFPPRAARGLGM